MADIFSKKENVEKADIKLVRKARSTDVFVALFMVLILIGIDTMPGIIRYLIMAAYFLIFIPISNIISATPGKISSHIRVRKKDNEEAKISLKESYTMLFLSVIDFILNIITFGYAKSFSEKYKSIVHVTIKEKVSDDVLKEYQKQRAISGFITVSVVYLLWTIWLGNFLFLLGLPVIFDMYVSKKINWTPWKKRNGENHLAVEWIDALIFAVLAVTIINIFLFQNYKIPTPSMEKTLRVGDHLFVSKTKYGPRIPNTPLAFPFAQNRIGKIESYSKLIQWDYKRLKGFREIERNDIVVFNFPAGDTVFFDMSENSYWTYIHEATNYYRSLDESKGYTESQLIQLARKNLESEHPVKVRPVDRRDNYIKRCVAIPGDTLQIIDGYVYTNSQKEPANETLQFKYQVFTNGQKIRDNIFEKLDLSKSSGDISENYGYYILNLTEEGYKTIDNNPVVVKIEKNKPFRSDYSIYPNTRNSYGWTLDNFGPFVIPKKGSTVSLNLENLPLYQRIINAYERHHLEVKDSVIYIDHEPVDSYTFEMDYYFMMGDNRHGSYDSRYWGVVPEDHIVGAPKFIWLSLDKDKKFPFNIRLNRMFKVVG